MKSLSYFVFLITAVVLLPVLYSNSHKTKSRCEEYRELKEKRLKGKAEILIKKCKGVNGLDEFGFNPLYYAVTDNDINLVKYLLENGAKVNACDKYGYTALHHAAVLDGSDIITLLLDHGADANSKTSLGATPGDISANQRNYYLLKRYAIKQCLGETMPEITKDIELPIWATKNISAMQIDNALMLGVPPAIEIDIGSDIPIKMVFIPAGSFEFIVPDKWGNKIDMKSSMKTIPVDKPFYMAITELTQGQWKAIMGSNPSEYKNDDNPVERVSWNDCQLFIKKLNDKKTDWHFRLPYDAEWEYACLAGSPQANCSAKKNMLYGNAESVGLNDRYTQVAPVGCFSRNNWGLYDMLGNVNEWCQDEWSSLLKPLSKNNRNADDIDENTVRIYRGGAWDTPKDLCTNSIREWCASYAGNDRIGFRLVMDVDTYK